MWVRVAEGGRRKERPISTGATRGRERSETRPGTVGRAAALSAESGLQSTAQPSQTGVSAVLADAWTQLEMWTSGAHKANLRRLLVCSFAAFCMVCAACVPSNACICLCCERVHA